MKVQLVLQVPVQLKAALAASAKAQGASMTAEVISRLSVSLGADGYDVAPVDVTAIAGCQRIEMVIVPERLLKRRKQ